MRVEVNRVLATWGFWLPLASKKAYVKVELHVTLSFVLMEITEEPAEVNLSFC